MSSLSLRQPLPKPIVLPDGQSIASLGDLHQHISRMTEPRPLIFDVIRRMLNSAQSNGQIENAARLFFLAINKCSASETSVIQRGSTQ